MICDYLHDDDEEGKGNNSQETLTLFIRTYSYLNMDKHERDTRANSTKTIRSILITIYFGAEFDSLMSSICLVGRPLLARTK